MNAGYRNQPNQLSDPNGAHGYTGDSSVAHAAREKAADALEWARESSTRAFDTGKERTAERIHDVASAIHAAGSQLHDAEHDETIARYMDTLADKVDAAAGYLRSRNAQALREDAECLAREHPALFLGGAVLAGIAIGRFLRSSAHHRDQAYQNQAYERARSDSGQPWQRPAGPADPGASYGAPSTYSPVAGGSSRPVTSMSGGASTRSASSGPASSTYRSTPPPVPTPSPSSSSSSSAGRQSQSREREGVE